MSHKQDSLTLVPGCWYGWQMLPGYSLTYEPYYSPIRVQGVTPKKTGHRILDLSFFNAFYASGVQGFQLDLRVLAHHEHYMVAELIYGGEAPRRAAIISTISFEWVRTHCPEMWRQRPPSALGQRAQEDVSGYLNALFAR